jgi:ATP-dependent protease HslVU (ClpYQ) peptidase subunit
MTCIVGLFDEKDNCVYMGGDSCGADSNWNKTIRLDRKVFKTKDTPEAIMGFTTSFRMGQLLMYGTGLIDELAIKKDQIDHEYLVTKFVPHIIKLFEDGGFATNKNGEKTGGTFLFAYKNRLYQIQSDFQVAMSTEDFDVCGCGENYALGSLYSTKDTQLNSIERLHKALQTATKFNAGVAAPYYIINTKNNDVVEFKN